MGLFDGLFPAMKEAKDSLFNSDSKFRRHRGVLKDAGTGKKAAQPAHDKTAGPSEKQVLKDAAKDAAAAGRVSLSKTLAGQEGAAAAKSKPRKRKAADALEAPTLPADTPAAGFPQGKPLAKKKRPKAPFKPPRPAAGEDPPLVASSKHPDTEQTTAVKTQETDRVLKTNPSKKRQAKNGLQGPRAAPADAANAAAHQVMRKQAPHSGSPVGGSSSVHMAADLNENAAVEGDEPYNDASADEDGSMAEDPPGAADGTAVRPRLTEKQRAERLQRTVFIGNLPAAVKAKRIKQAFSRFGTVESVRLRSLPLKEGVKLPRKAAIASGHVDTDRASAHAYVVFSKRASAAYALQLNMSEFEGRHIRVDLAAGVSKSIRGGGKNVLYDPSKSVFLGNLPFDVTEEDLIRLFGGGRGAGSVTAVRVVRDAKSNKGKGIAYVEFQSRNDARMALGFDGHTLAGRAVRVTRVAAGPAAAEQQAVASKLRTPYSKGVKIGRGARVGPAKEFGRRAGAVGSPAAAAWQGLRTKGQKKLVKGSAGKPRDVPAPAQAGRKPGQKAAQQPGMGKRVGKRPAVAARKSGGQKMSKK